VLQLYLQVFTQSCLLRYALIFPRFSLLAICQLHFSFLPKASFFFVLGVCPLSRFIWPISRVPATFPEDFSSSCNGPPLSRWCILESLHPPFKVCRCPSPGCDRPTAYAHAIPKRSQPPFHALDEAGRRVFLPPLPSSSSGSLFFPRSKNSGIFVSPICGGFLFFVGDSARFSASR